MIEYIYDMNPVDQIVADAHGEPGNRIFFLQASAGNQSVSLVLEKEEVANLAVNVLALLEELEKKYPYLPPTSSSNDPLYPQHPLDPTFRIGQLILGYDEENDTIWVIAKALVITETGTAIDPDDEGVPTTRFVATRNQMRAMSEHALEVVSNGRPICPLCNRSIDRSGHFCPRTDGHAVSIAL